MASIRLNSFGALSSDRMDTGYPIAHACSGQFEKSGEEIGNFKMLSSLIETKARRGTYESHTCAHNGPTRTRLHEGLIRFYPPCHKSTLFPSGRKVYAGKNRAAQEEEEEQEHEESTTRLARGNEQKGARGVSVK